jgi:hypothetical protein
VHVRIAIATERVKALLIGADPQNVRRSGHVRMVSARADPSERIDRANS